ncbi:hypothetical protein BS636_01155 [Acinetobacter sp. LoGeW2-3]|uniref:hypothetical protein n=1 Tax=Acinetobacter sp. LoGeW2-3 TaxID=1808001 RepID=UPI000C05C68D|nr:hypothetical protein [Acinetobacter sp. LoGeW2-3]ATO18378.1 hypothetical protein BS636_01155 [Acinetobacter sp. LoGeW2-3]
MDIKEEVEAIQEKPSTQYKAEKASTFFINFISLLKENLSFLVIIPTLMGGLFQLIKLASLDTSYIRFFSVSQVVADGLTVLFCIILVGLLISSFKFAISDYLPIHDEKYSYRTFIQFFIIAIFAFLGYQLILSENPFKFSSIVWAVSAKIGLSLLGYYVIAFFIKKHFSSLTNILIFIRAVLTLSILFFCIKFIISVNNIYSNFNNLENTVILTNKLQSSLKLKEKPTFIYFNKDYVFFKYIEDEKEKFIVIDGSELVLKFEK